MTMRCIWQTASTVSLATALMVVSGCQSTGDRQQTQQVQTTASAQEQPASQTFEWEVHDMSRPKPPVVTPGGPALVAPPSDAVVLFDGSNLSQWVRQEDGTPARWALEDGAMRVTSTGGIRSIPEFGDCQLHIEWAAPNPANGNGQGRGNSGVFLMGLYEVQVLDSYENPTYADGQAASIYGQYPPSVNASLKPGEWQSYDIIFRRPRFNDDGTVREPARITVLHNGVLVQNNVTILGQTTHKQRARYAPHGDKGPISLQDHGDPVRFRNIWVRPLE